MPAPVKNFFKGTINRFEPQTIARGAASRSLNWVTMGDKAELRRGMRLLGDEIEGTGKSWVHVAKKADGTDLLFRKRGRKLEYYTPSTNTWTESGSNLFPADAVNDEPWFANYNSLSGAQLLISSENSSIYKIMVANPGDPVDLLSTTFRGRIRVWLNRLLLWRRYNSTANKDDTGLYGSYLDKDEVSDYAAVTSESISGSGATRSGTLAFKSGAPKRTCFGVSFTDGTETFTDDYNGVLSGSAGGTGTINYATGVYSVTFAVDPGLNPVTANYYWEDSTSTGVADFSKSTPRTAGQGFVLRQDDDGKLQNVFAYRDVLYPMHEDKTWVTNLTNTDTNATNLPFRSKVGIPNGRAGCETGDGIYYVDDTDENDPRIRLLTVNQVSTEVVPVSISDQLDLSDYRFNHAVVFEWGRYILVACRLSDSDENNRLLAYDRLLKAWDTHDYIVGNLAILDGALVSGDAVTPNVYELFSGVDEDESTIANFWEGSLDDLALDELKKTKRLRLSGEIGPDQKLKVSVSLDNGPFVEVRHPRTPTAYAIEGAGSYVNHGQSVAVGAPTFGRTEIGGGSVGNLEAYVYEREIPLRLDRFERIMIRFEAMALGYVSVSGYEFRDIRGKGRKAPSKYRS